MKNKQNKKMILDSINNAVFNINRNWELLSSKISKKNKKNFDDMNGKKIDDIFPSDFSDKIKRHGELALHTYEIEIFEYKFEGSENKKNYEIQIVVSGEDEILVSVRDVTQKKQAEEHTKYKLSILRRAMGGIINAIAMTVETRDSYTAGHQRRVANLARAIALKLNLSKDKVEGIRMAGVIHDLGKISVPSEILTKPGKIRSIEFELIKIHPEVGYDILKTIEFPWPVAEIVYQHHEKIDGSGYPRGLKGDEILQEAKIIAVADVVEAMASHRPYRPALGINIALKEVEANKGTFYDSDAVDACIELFKKDGFSFVESKNYFEKKIDDKL